MMVIVPSRGRPDNVLALRDAFRSTQGGAADLLFAFDEDDETMVTSEVLDKVDYVVGERLRLIGTLNLVALGAVEDEGYDYVGFMGDDHRPRTAGWDLKIREQLKTMGTGIVYGNDLFQGANLPTAVFMTADIIGVLGYMAPPCLTHMFADNAWRAWGEGIGRFVYMPDVVIEHMHPEVGKAKTDDRYLDVWPYLALDRPKWDGYCQNELAGDLVKLRALL